MVCWDPSALGAVIIFLGIVWGMVQNKMRVGWLVGWLADWAWSLVSTLGQTGAAV